MAELSLETNMTLSDGAILVIDSGIGGVSILNALTIKLPEEHFIYFADYAFLPYGEKTSEQIKSRCLGIVNSFTSSHSNIPIKAVVLACNSATTSAISFLRSSQNLAHLEFFGTEPGLKPASLKSELGIAVLATELTLNSTQFKTLTKQYASGVPLYCQPAPELVNLVESGNWNNQISEQVIKSTLAKITEPFDMLLLGCTHFCFLKDQLKGILGCSVDVLDTSDAIAERVASKLGSESLLNSRNKTKEETKEGTKLVLSYSIPPVELDKSSVISQLQLLKASIHPSFTIMTTEHRQVFEKVNT